MGESCPSVELLAAFASGELQLTQHNHVELHVHRCGACFALVARASHPSTVGEAAPQALLSTLNQEVAPDDRLRDAFFGGHARFEIVRELGHGAMGIVYEAFDRERLRRVALKTLAQPSAEGLLRFKKEFRALRDVRHPNLVRLGELIGGPPWFFTMELIEGVHFHEYSQPTANAPLDEHRLRRSFAQLASGLAALHAAGKVHRDVKPSNVLVTSDGRVVLLDFGLVMDSRGDDGSSGGKVLGTVAYMAPEQAAARPLGPAADWYATGVLLYQALTGQLPFNGSAISVLMEKQQHEPSPPRLVAPTVPPDLNDLCIELLRTDPAARPEAADILRRLGAGAPLRPLASDGPIFVGREPELSVLQAAFAETRRGHGAAVLITGEPGIGKTALVRHFSEQQRRSGATVLVGRCSEQESVPFNAFDGVVDALSRELGSLPAAEVAALLPRNVSLLTHVFPVLLRVQAIAQAPRPRVDTTDSNEVRQRAFAALRELLARLADRRPLVVVLDDLQWADADSVALLDLIIRPPEAPPLLLLGISRASASNVLLGATSRLTLAGLVERDAQTLAARLLVLVDDGAALAPIIAREAHGHPLFLDELARHVTSHSHETAAPLRLEEALRLRLKRLEPALLQLLELTTVAGIPLRHTLLARAAALDPAALVDGLEWLREQHLIRSSGLHAQDVVEPFHARVRDAVLEHLSAERRRHHHEQLALTLADDADVPPEMLAIHWKGAGEPQRASAPLLRAAEQADTAWAFHRAARLYREALALLPDGGDSVQRARLGWALANAGHVCEAGEVFLTIAALTEGVEASGWHACAVEQFLRGGRSDRGLALLKEMLRQAGLTLPSTPGETARLLLPARLRLRLRGLQPTERSVLTSKQRRLLQVYRAAAFGLMDSARGLSFSSRLLLLELDAGEPDNLCRALSIEAHFEAMAGPRQTSRIAALHRTAQTVAERSGTPLARSWAEAGQSNSAFGLGHWRHAVNACQRARLIMETQCKNVQMNIYWLRTIELWSRWHLGEVEQLLSLSETFAQDAMTRGDLFALMLSRVAETVNGWLAVDDPAGGRERLEAALRDAVLDEAQYLWFMSHYSRAQLALYQGDVDACLREVDAIDARTSSRLFTRFFGGAAVRSSDLRARARLADLVRRGDAGRSQCKRIAADARALVELGAVHSVPMGRLLQSGIAQRLARDEEAAHHAQAAADGFGAADMPLYRAVALRRRGELLGGDEGAALVTSANAAMAQLGVRAPDKIAALLAPSPPRA